VEAKAAQIRVLKKAADNPKLKTAALVDEFTSECQDPGFRTRAVKVKLLQRQIQMRKAKALHSVKAPQTFDDLATIPEEFKVFFINAAGLRNEIIVPFLQTQQVKSYVK
jgi:hypothetical protein